jgi:hypothetical protein
MQTLNIERAVMREIERDGARRPHFIKTAAGLSPASPLYRGLMRQMEQRGLIFADFSTMPATWRLTDPGRAAIAVAA